MNNTNQKIKPESSITIFYRYLGATKMMPWKGVITAAARWFESKHPSNVQFVGAVETDAFKDLLKEL